MGTRTGDPGAAKPAVRTPATWGLVFGATQAASPLAFWWLDAAAAYALGLVLIASIYIGFAVADGRATVIAVESTVAAIFVIVASAAVTASPSLLVLRLPATGQGSLAAPPEVCREHRVVASSGRIGEAVGDLQMSTRCIDRHR